MRHTAILPLASTSPTSEHHITQQLKIEQPFNLELSLTMGQSFRWHKLPTDFYGDAISGFPVC